MKSLRTPDDRFANLDGYDFAPNYVEVDDSEGGTLRVHYLDEGPADGQIILCMHGEPSWSYLYRKMVPLLVAKGFRVVAPDLVGFGRSDKPAEQSDYTYQRHVDWMTSALLDELRLQHINLFAQDWGGLIGLRLVGEHPDRFDRVIVGNTGLPDGVGAPSEAFSNWQRFSQSTPDFDVGFLLNSGTTSELSEAEIAAYDAPFPDDSFKQGARIFPMLVPTSADDPAVPANTAAWNVLREWNKPFVTCFSDSDPITAGGERVFQSRIAGAQGQAHVTVEGAGHFFQEDAPEALVEVVASTVGSGAS